MAAGYDDDTVPGFHVPVHRSLTDPILLGGAPRTLAIANGTLGAAISLGLRLWLVGAVFWVIGHTLAVWGAKRDPLVRRGGTVASPLPRLAACVRRAGP